MGDKFKMWSKNCHDGKVFDEEEDGPEAVWGRKGWVDNPAKLGINIYQGHADKGADHEEAVQLLKRRHDIGAVKNVSNPDYMTEEEENELTQLRREKKEREAELRGDRNLTKEMNEKKEEFNDDINEVTKEVGPVHTGHTTVPEQEADPLEL